jgi:glutathione peroxidase-family protein
MSLLSSVRTYASRATLPAGDLYRHRLTLLDGSELDLATRRGSPTLLVNTASKCGFVAQFHGLQTVHARYHERGLLVLGCPSADFGDQEFESCDEIGLVAEGLYEVEFPLTEPMAVRFGANRFWEDVAAQPNSGPPVWNFTKYLIGGDGRIRGWWSTNVRPENRRITEAIEAAL